MIITQAVATLMTAYDRNGDGIITRKKEATRKEEWPSRKDGGNGAPDRLTTTLWGRGNLFANADTNRDGKVTRKELTAHLTLFDTNKNGMLESKGFNFLAKDKEWEQFQATYPEDIVTQTVTNL